MKSVRRRKRRSAVEGSTSDSIVPVRVPGTTPVSNETLKTAFRFVQSRFFATGWLVRLGARALPRERRRRGRQFFGVEYLMQESQGHGCAQDGAIAFLPHLQTVEEGLHIGIISPAPHRPFCPMEQTQEDA